MPHSRELPEKGPSSFQEVPIAVSKRGQWWAIYWLALLSLILTHLGYSGYLTWLPTSGPDERRNPAAPNDGEWLLQMLRDQPVESPVQLAGVDLVWLAAYQNGYLQHTRLDYRRPPGVVLQSWLSELRGGGWETLEVGLGRRLTSTSLNSLPPTWDTGLWGLLLATPAASICLSPGEFMRRGQSPKEIYSRLDRERGILQARSFSCDQWLIHSDSKVVPLVRAEPLVDRSSLSYARIKSASLALARFQQRATNRNHELLPYRVLVSQGSFSEEDRLFVRNCLGSWSLANFASFTGDPKDQQLSQKHLETMIGQFGRWNRELALISDQPRVHLGSLALFGLALLNQPKATDQLKRFERGIAQSVLHSQQPGGHFLTSLWLPGHKVPAPLNPEKDPNQDFFPGETLLYLASRALQDPRGPWLKAFDHSFPYYRDRFRRRPHPAAVPWLVQACVQRYRVDGQPEAADFALVLSDWYLDHLQPYSEMDPFLRGSCINPEGKPFGRIAATAGVGVQLEGLVEAWWLARRLGDAARSERYRQAILESSRYLLQMQYRSVEELYWLTPARRELALGGLRDLPWEPRIQVDTTAHTLNAWLHLLSNCGADELGVLSP